MRHECTTVFTLSWRDPCIQVCSRLAAAMHCTSRAESANTSSKERDDGAMTETAANRGGGGARLLNNNTYATPNFLTR